MLVEIAAATVEVGTAGNDATFAPVKLDNNRLFTVSEIDRHILHPVLDRHIGPEAITQILEDARSSTTTRSWPWNYYLASDGQRSAIRDTLLSTMNSFMVAKKNKYRHFNREWRTPHHGAVDDGDPIYQSFERLEPDKQRLMKSYYRCMHLLQSPIFLFFTVDQCPVERSWLEYGDFLNRTIVSAARLGLVVETTGFAPFHDLIRKILQWDKAETPICGMSMHCASTATMKEVFPMRRN